MNNIYHEILTDNLVDHLMIQEIQRSAKSLVNRSQIMHCLHLVAQLLLESHRILRISFDCLDLINILRPPFARCKDLDNVLISVYSDNLIFETSTSAHLYLVSVSRNLHC